MEAQGVQGPVINQNSNFNIIKRVRIDFDDLITITTNKSGNACCNNQLLLQNNLHSTWQLAWPGVYGSDVYMIFLVLVLVRRKPGALYNYKCISEQDRRQIRVPLRQINYSV